MTTITVTWANAAQSQIIYVSGGVTSYVPDDMANSDRQTIATWVNQGNIISPYVTPPVPIPSPVQMWQAKAALQLAGKLDAANSAVVAMNNPVLTSFWNDASFIDRASPTLGQIGINLSMTPADIDALFIKAASLKL